MPNWSHTLPWQSWVSLQHSKATMPRTKGSSAQGTRALKAPTAELHPSRTTQLHPPCTLPSCSTESYTLDFSKSMIWKGGTHPTLARWCFSSGRGEEKSRALLIISPQIQVLLHQSLNSHWRGDTSLQSFRLNSSFPLAKSVSASGILLPQALTAPSRNGLCVQEHQCSLPLWKEKCSWWWAHFMDAQPGWFIWAAHTALVTDYRITASELINHVLCKQENLTDLKIRVTCM